MSIGSPPHKKIADYFNGVVLFGVFGEYDLLCFRNACMFRVNIVDP